MDNITRKQFDEHYSGSHTEMSALDNLVKGRTGNLVKKSPGDKNIYTNGKIKGKNIIEHKCFNERAEKFRGYLLDAVAVRNMEILDEKKMPMDKLVGHVIRSLPQKQEVKMEASFTFADMVKKAKLEVETYEDIDE